MHYALVSDLISEEEFNERVEAKSAEHHGIIDEVTAAMMVVDDLGRSHVKIGDIPRAAAGVVSFFGKILSIEGPREFTREGEEEPGLVASLVLGDPTGTTKMTLWDERAAGVSELTVGSVVEVIAKPKPGRKEVGFVAIRESCVEIVETKKPPTSELLNQPLVVKILVMPEMREIAKRDGSVSYLQEFIVGDESGTTRLSTWSPENFSDVDEGSSVSITGVERREDDGVVEYSALATAVVSPHLPEVSVLTIDAGDVEEGPNPVVCGTVVSVSDVRTFETRRNTMSQVRNITVQGESGASVSAALWGEAAAVFLLPGDRVQIINAVAKESRFAGLELSVGRGAAIRVLLPTEEEAELCGCVIARGSGMTLETDAGAYVLLGENLPEPGMVVSVYGTLQGGRLTVAEAEGIAPDVGAILERAKGL
ncbi:MAG: nucleotide-binding protein [Methanocorpusculum sp.]|nr:nucleotide-binding protein [Methanocorpusculum sp.]